MDYTQLRDAILQSKPKYSAKYKDMIDRISKKGDASGKGDFATFGAYYQTFMYAYIIGLRLGEKTELPKDFKKEDFAPISSWKPDVIRDFILITLFNRTEQISESEGESYNLASLENVSKEYILEIFVPDLVKEMERYANTGFQYLQNKWDNEHIIFSDPFVFVDILQELTATQKETIDEKQNEHLDKI